MTREYALEGVGHFKHWSDAYPRLGDARRAAKDIVRGKSVKVHILQRAPAQPGQIGSSWNIVGVVSSGDPPSVYRAFAKTCQKQGAA